MPKAYRRAPGRVALIAILCATQLCCGSNDAPRASAARRTLTIPAPSPSTPTTATAAEQQTFMRESARKGWTYVSHEVGSNGFIGATETYPFLTVWDMGSLLAAAYSAHALGFIGDTAYHAFVDRTLGSIEQLPLFDHAALNRMYDAHSGAIVNGKGLPSAAGLGWSSLDHGRLLIWLRLVAADDPASAPRARAIVARLDLARIIHGGYMQGEEVNPATGERRSYQEGRVGYEQYAAEGFALWGAVADSALDFAANGRPVHIEGETLITDARGGDVLTSEPFVLMGLELGWPSATWRNLALAVLAAQETRYKDTGIVTMVSEDAVPDPPSYFYYYLLFRDGRPFVVSTVGGTVRDSFPRWVSAKAAFGYHALAPSDYTWRALQAVKWGSSADGWTAGVYEGTRTSTKLFNLNTAAIVLESAAYAARGCAFIQRACPK